MGNITSFEELLGYAGKTVKASFTKGKAGYYKVDDKPFSLGGGKKIIYLYEGVEPWAEHCYFARVVVPEDFDGLTSSIPVIFPVDNNEEVGNLWFWS